MTQYRHRYRHRRKGFTLVEVLIVIVIVIVVAGLALSMSRKAIQSAKSTKETGNLKQAGMALSVYISELGYYPAGWNASEKVSWADLIIRDQAGGKTNVTQSPMFWSPLWVSEVPSTLNSEAVTHFGANPALMTDAVDDGAGTMVPKFRIQTSKIVRPSELIVLGSAVSKTSSAKYRASEPVMRDLAALIGGPGSAGTPPQLDEQNANNPIKYPAKTGEKESYGSMPDFHRNGGNKGQFFFADGHIESMTPSSQRERNWAVSY